MLLLLRRIHLRLLMLLGSSSGHWAGASVVHCGSGIGDVFPLFHRNGDLPPVDSDGSRMLLLLLLLLLMLLLGCLGRHRNLSSSHRTLRVHMGHVPVGRPRWHRRLLLLWLLLLLLLRRRRKHFPQLLADGSKLIGRDVLQIGLLVEFHQQLHGVELGRQWRGSVWRLGRRKSLRANDPVIPVAVQEGLA